MKLWVDATNPAPNNYSWVKDVDVAIAAIEHHDHAVEIGMRRGRGCFLNRDYAGRTKCYEFANRHDITEISIAESLVGSDELKRLRDHLIKISRMQSCEITVH